MHLLRPTLLRSVLLSTPVVVLLAVAGTAACQPGEARDVEAAPAGGPVCGADAGEPLRRSVLAELNAERRRSGLATVEPHPALCATAAWRAAGVAASGEITSDVEVLRQTTRRLQGGGYRAHRWIESTLIGSRDEGLLEQWRGANPRWLEQAVEGDFEHVGVGLGRYQGRPVVSLLLAFTTRTAEGLQAAPLADLEQVRALALKAVNRAREEAGLRPVAGNPQLDAAAQAHAEDMLRRSYYSHQSPQGTNTTQRVRVAGYRPQGPMAENIAKGLFDPEEVVERWLASPGHRKNILLRRVRYVGLGVAFGDNDHGFEVLWAQVFGG